jgi:hypothetical protein
MTSQRINTGTLSEGNGTARPFVAYVNGELLRGKNGVARRFKTEQSALAAGEQNVDAFWGEVGKLAAALAKSTAHPLLSTEH